MQRNDGPCCYNIHNTHLNPTAHIRDNKCLYGLYCNERFWNSETLHI